MRPFLARLIMIIVFTLVLNLTDHNLACATTSDEKPVLTNNLAPEFLSMVDFPSEYMEEKRPILVNLPESYYQGTEKTYPVLYTLNDSDNFEWASYIVKLLAGRFAIGEVIVVGLPHTGNYAQDNYPFEARGKTALSSQAQNYSRFIRDEAIPYITDNYRTNDGRYIVGHSLSGLFVLQMFMQHPDVFSAHVVLSPSLHRAPQMIDIVGDHLVGHPELGGNLYISIGAKEHVLIQESFEKMRNTFGEKASAGLHWTIETLDHHEHMLAAFKGTYVALTWLHDGYELSSQQLVQFSYQELIENYRNLSVRIGYTIKQRKKQLIGFSYFYLNRVPDVPKEQRRETVLKLLRLEDHYYPDDTDIQKRIIEVEADKSS